MIWDIRQIKYRFFRYLRLATTKNDGIPEDDLNSYQTLEVNICDSNPIQ